MVLRALMQSQALFNNQELLGTCVQITFEVFQNISASPSELGLEKFRLLSLAFEHRRHRLQLFSAGCPSLLPEIQGFEAEDRPVAHFDNFLSTYSWSPFLCALKT